MPERTASIGAAHPAAKSLLQRATAASPHLFDGLGPLILGAYECFIPKAVGGKPEIGLKRLETAASNPGSLQLAMKVAQAELCAYALQDRALILRKDVGASMLERGKSAFRRQDYPTSVEELTEIVAREYRLAPESASDN